MKISLRDLLEAGVHFGHQTRRWNPKMRPYIYGAKNGIHVIDLQSTARGLVNASRFVSSTVANGGQILFVGTKRAAADIVSEEAERCGQFFVNHRWLGGTMTNWQTVKKSIDRLLALERARDDGRFDLLTKKEALELSRDIGRMSRNLGGIKNIKGLPAAIFVIDPKREHIAVSEANKLGIPVIGLCDTNCDPSGIAHVIPGNDDALKAIRLFTSVIADAAIEGKAMSSKTGDVGNYEGARDANLEGVEVVRRSAGDVVPAVEASAAPAAAPAVAPATAPAVAPAEAPVVAPAEAPAAAPEPSTDA